MKASELIKKMQYEIDIHGDLEVSVCTQCYGSDTMAIYTEKDINKIIIDMDQE